MRAVILAAGRGARLAPLTDDRPKPLVEVLGRSLLLRTLDRLREAGIDDRAVIIVTGYREAMIRQVVAREGLGCELVYNPRWADWNNWYSLRVARDALRGEAFLQFDGDVVFDAPLLPRMLAGSGAAIAVEVRPMPDDEAMKAEASDGLLRGLSKQLPAARAIGEYIGITRLDEAAAQAVFADLDQFEAEQITHEYYDHSYHRLASSGRVDFRVVDVADCRAYEVDDVADLQRAEARLTARGAA